MLPRKAERADKVWAFRTQMPMPVAATSQTLVAAACARAQAAEAAFRRAVELAPEKAGFRTPLSAMLFRQQRIEEGLAEARGAVAVEPMNARAHGYLGHVLQLLGQLEAAEASMRHAVGLDPRDASLTEQLVRLRARLG